MADQTHIEWTDATWNIITGCSVVSPGCTNCYAMRLAGTRLRHHPSRQGLTIETKAGPVWNGQVRFNWGWLDQPRRWSKPRKIFVCAHGDLFHDGVTDAQLDAIFVVMAECPQHVFQILTKRPGRMRAYINGLEKRRRELDANAGLDFVPWPLPNVWLGVSVEDHLRARERVHTLLTTMAAVRWVSAEPLVGEIDFTGLQDEFGWIDALRGDRHVSSPGDYQILRKQLPALDWVVVGGESGRDARPVHPKWVRRIERQCATSSVAFLLKQWGEFLPDGEHDVGQVIWDAGTDDPKVHRFEDGTAVIRLGKSMAGRHLDGVIHDGYPEPSHV